MVFQHLIYTIQQLTLLRGLENDDDDKKEPELNKQLRILVTRLASSIMIFAVIRQSLDFSEKK